MQFRFLSEAVLSPDAAKVCYIVKQADAGENSYHSALWMTDLADRSNRLMAERGGVRTAIWLDAETILFASDRDVQGKEDAKETKFYSISAKGGEAEGYMTVPGKADKIFSLGEGRWLVAETADDTPAKRQTEDSREMAVEGKDYHIFDELPFRFNGKGVVNKKRPALYIFREGETEMERITPEYFETISWDVSPDHRYVAFCGPCYDSIRPTEWGILIYDLVNGTIRELSGIGKHNTDHVCFTGNHELFYAGMTRERMGKNPRFYRYDLEKDIVTELPFHDMMIGNSVGSDAKMGAGKAMGWQQENGLLYMIRTSWGDSSLAALDREGAITVITREPGAVCGFDIRYPQEGGRPVCVITAMRGQHLAELYQVDLESGAETRLTFFNDEYLKSHTVQEPQSFRYMGKNGYEMEAYVICPADYEPGKKYPAVFEIHGGPKGVLGTAFFHEFQCLASMGCFVFYGNPRGSDGRGEKYADITEVFGTDDFNDLMELFDEALSRYPDIDETHVGICGGSYGGFMCNWMVGHTDRFAAAVSQRSISNYLTKCLYTDIGYYANWLQMGAYPWEDFDKIWSMSPLKEAPSAKTPLLLLQSDEDYRCWQGDAIQMFSAVKRAGADTRLVLFHGENHELSRSGKPQNRMKRMEELMGWFEKYLHIIKEE